MKKNGKSTYNKESYEKNKEKIFERVKKYEEKNRDKQKQWAKNAYIRRKEKIAKLKRFYEEHRRREEEE